MLHRLPRLGAALMLSLFLFSASPAYAWHFHGGPVHDTENINLEKKILEQVKEIHTNTDRVAAYARLTAAFCLPQSSCLFSGSIKSSIIPD